MLAMPCGSRVLSSISGLKGLSLLRRVIVRKPPHPSHVLSFFPAFMSTKLTIHPSKELHRLETHSYHRNSQNPTYPIQDSLSTIEWATPKTYQDTPPKHQLDLVIHPIHLKIPARDNFTPTIHCDTTKKMQTRCLQSTPQKLNLAIVTHLDT
jgi:hypothetical protein